MGLTRHSGPLYGAKSLLFTVHRDNTDVASSVAITEALVVVPNYEEWLVTEFRVFRGSSGSTAATYTFALVDDSTTIADVATASSAASLSLSTTLAPTAGEYEGVLVASNSTLAFTHTRGGSTTAPCSNITMSAYGFIRFKSSSNRSEG
jgi:hypothetical protein